MPTMLAYLLAVSSYTAAVALAIFVLGADMANATDIQGASQLEAVRTAALKIGF